MNTFICFYEYWSIQKTFYILYTEYLSSRHCQLDNFQCEKKRKEKAKYETTKEKKKNAYYSYTVYTRKKGTFYFD